MIHQVREGLEQTSCSWLVPVVPCNHKKKVVLLYSPGLLPTLKGPYIYQAELIDLAFHLLIHDLLPITKELGINATKLTSYRPAFHPSHLEMGTIKLLMGLKVDHIYREIVKLHYQTFAIKGSIGKDGIIANLKCLLTFTVQKDYPVIHRLW